jgi:hypothetical protein
MLGPRWRVCQPLSKGKKMGENQPDPAVNDEQLETAAEEVADVEGHSVEDEKNQAAPFYDVNYGCA